LLERMALSQMQKFSWSSCTFAIWRNRNCVFSYAWICGLSYVRDTRARTPLFSAVVTWTHAGSCWPWKGPLDTNRWCRLAAPIAWESTLDTRTPSLRTCCEPACDAGSPLVELPVDFTFTWWQCRCDYIWSLLVGAYLYTGGKTAAKQ
jgi:hypothetical protein